MLPWNKRAQTCMNTHGKKLYVILLLVSVGIVVSMLQTGYVKDRHSTSYPRTASSEVDTQSYLLHYTWHNGSDAVTGREFQLWPDLLQVLAIPLTHFITLNEHTAPHFVFVTGTSDSHFEKSFKTISSIQDFMPNHTIYFYDLGLNRTNRNMVQSWRGVVYKKFNFSMYPGHVLNLHTYAFKPLIIHEVLRTEPGVLWVDAISRVETSDFTPIFRFVITNGGFTFMHKGGGLSTFSGTDPKLWYYLCSDPDRLKQSPMYGASIVLLYRTEPVYRSMLLYWALCALTQECIAPTWSSRGCSPPEPQHDWDSRVQRYRNCHRQDQSVLNTLVANFYHFNTTLYFHEDFKQIVRLVRHGTDYSHVVPKSL